MAFCVALATGASAQIFTENAGVTSPETPTLREYFTVFDSENLTDVRLNHQWLLGLNRRTELRVTIPTVLHRRATLKGLLGAHADATMAGLGDVTLRLKYSLAQTDDVMESTRWALLTEIKTPTGEDDEKHARLRLPRKLQLGTGAWAYGIGTAYTLIRDRHRFSTDFIYRHPTRHDGVRLGQSVHWNMAYWVRIAPEQHDPDHETTEVRAVIELLSSYTFDSHIDGHDRNDGGPLVWLAPGIQVYPRRDVLIEASVQIPVYQDIDDPLGDRRWGFLFAVKFLF